MASAAEALRSAQGPKANETLRRLSKAKMNAPEEHNTPDEDTYQRVTVQQHVEQAIYNNVNHVFTEAELRRAEKIPGSMKLKAGEWLKYPPRVAMVKSVQMLTATYKRRDRWGTVLYKPAVFPDDNFLSA